MLGNVICILIWIYIVDCVCLCGCVKIYVLNVILNVFILYGKCFGFFVILLLCKVYIICYSIIFKIINILVVIK